jgi:hypothetical protein
MRIFSFALFACVLGASLNVTVTDMGFQSAATANLTAINANVGDTSKTLMLLF